MQENFQDEISLKELLLTLWRGKGLIIIISLIAIGLSMMASFWMKNQSYGVSIVVAFKHDGIESHLNPDGSKFDPYQIASPYVLDEVIKGMQLDGVISPNTIRKNLVMTPIIPDDVKAMQTFSLEKQGDTIVYYPDEYVLTVSADPGAGMDVNMTQSVVDHLISTYRDHFTHEYIQRDRLSDLLGFSDTSNYDYVDLSMVFENQLKAILSFNENNARLAPQFRSKQTGLTFNDIIESVGVINDVDLTRWNSLVSSYKLSKKPDELMMYYNYQINNLTDALNILKSENSVNLQTLSSLEDSDNALVGALSNQDSKESSYFQTLIMSTVDTATSISFKERQIDHYKMEVQDIESGQRLGSQRSALIEKSDAMVASLYTDLSHWIDISNQTADEFYDRYLSSSFFALSPSVVTNTVRLPLNIAIGSILGFMVAVFLVFFKAYWSNDNHGGING